MNSITVSKRYNFLLVLLVQLISSLAFAENGEIKIFGFVSLPIDRPAVITRRLDHLASPSASIMAQFKNYLSSQGADTELEKISAVNSWVNGKIEFTNDLDDQWKNANQTLAAGKGDCEDHAITKLQLLRNIGFADDQLLFMVVNDLALRQMHAILVVEVDGEYYVLDNVTDKLLPHRQFSSVFTPMWAVTSKKSWTFGIQRNQEVE